MIYNVISYLEHSAAARPDRVAVADAERALTYRELWDTVCRAGTLISQRLSGKNNPVAVFITHSAFDIISFLSIAYSGNFYVPVDLALPENRVIDILNTISPKAVISKDNTGFCVDNSVLLTQDDLSKDVKAYDPCWKSCKDTDLLYVIFTSGSTGVPKGVAVSHRSVIDMAEQFVSTFGFDESTVIGNQAPFDFDISVKDIYISLKVGGRLEILEKRLFSFPKLLIERMNERKINTVIWAVAALKIMSSLNAFKNIQPQYLENILFSGEVLPSKSLEYWRSKYPTARFVNLYGPTEITCNCTYYIVSDGDNTEDLLPIGYPFANCSVFLLDDDNNPVTSDGVGEICVSGSCLAHGYYNAPDITAAAFVQNPLQKSFPERIYRTGDIGTYKDGKLCFMGRKDTQIKHMGHRIEMTEIELCANSADGVTVSACVYDADAARIVLFYQGGADPKQLLLYIRDKLPKYMLPSECRHVDSFVQTRTGKIDRKTLLQLAKRR